MGVCVCLRTSGPRLDIAIFGLQLYIYEAHIITTVMKLQEN